MSTNRKCNFQLKDIEGGQTIFNKNAKNALQNGLLVMWKEKILCDVLIKTANNTIPAHRNVLCVYSDYFRAMFTVGLQESRNTVAEIQMDSLPSDAVKNVVEYMYTGILTVTKMTVQELLVVCDMFQMIELKMACSDFIETQIDATNCLGIWEFGEKFVCDDLVKKARQLVKQRFAVVVQMEEFINMPTDRLLQIIQFEDLNLGLEGETAVLKAVVKWFENDVEARLSHFLNLLSSIRLKNVCQKFLDGFKKTTVVQENQAILNAIAAQLSSSNPQPSRHGNQYLYVVGGYLQSRTGPHSPRLKSVERYNFLADTWEMVADIPEVVSNIYTFSIHGKLLCLAMQSIQKDESENIFVDWFYEYDSLSDKWKDAVDSNEISTNVRKCLCNCLSTDGALTVCHKTNRIYIVTNNLIQFIPWQLDDGDVTMNSVHNVPPLEALQNGNFSNYQAIVCNDRLYVIGGEEYKSQREVFPQSHVYMFDTNSQKWSQKSCMSTHRSRFGIVELCGFIYVIGGYNGLRLQSMERYDPVLDQWMNVAAMNKARSHLKVLVHDGKIYAIGGKSYPVRFGALRKVLSQCEVYSPDTDQWTYITAMNQARCMFGAVVS